MTDNPFGSPDQPGSVTGGVDFDFDMSDQELLPPGNYNARCTEVAMSTSQAGNDMLIWDFLLTDFGTSVRSWTAITPAAKWKVVEYCAAMGVTIDEKDSRLKFSRQQMVGVQCVLEIEHRVNPNSGQKGYNIKRAKPGSIPKPENATTSSDIPF